MLEICLLDRKDDKNIDILFDMINTCWIETHSWYLEEGQKHKRYETILDLTNDTKYKDFVLLQDDGKIVGCLQMFIDDDKFYMGTLCLRKEYRSLGYSNYLIDEAKKSASKLDYSEIYIWVRECNTKLINYYQKMGFVLTGVSQEATFAFRSLVRHDYVTKCGLLEMKLPLK